MFNYNYPMSTPNYSLSDIAAASGNGYRNNDGGMWGDGAWWIIILFLFCFNGWGGNGWGNNGSGFQGTTTREELNYGFDMSDLKSGVNGLASSLCNGFSGVNTNLLSGFANLAETNNANTRTLQSDISNMGMNNMQNTFSITQAINADTVAGMQNTNNLTQQLNNMAAINAQCCCENKQLIQSSFADLNYNLASIACQNRQATVDGVRDIIDNNNANMRSILDFLVQDKIETLTSENSALKNQISQNLQNAYLIDQLSPKATPAYIVANPYTGISYTSYGCGYGSGCGCNS